MQVTPLEIPLNSLDVEFEVSHNDWEITPGKRHHRHPRSGAIVSFTGSASKIHPNYFKELHIQPERGKRCGAYVHLSFGANGTVYDSTRSDSEAFMGSLEVVNIGAPAYGEEPREALHFTLRASLPYEDLTPILAIRGDRILIKLSMWGEDGKAYGERLGDGSLHIKVRWITLSRILEG